MGANFRNSIVAVLCLLSIILLPASIHAQSLSHTEEMLEGEIVKIVQEGQETVLNELVPFQELSILITRGTKKGEYIEIKNSASMGEVSVINYEEYKPGEKIRIYSSYDFEDKPIFSIAGKIKRQGLINLVILFVICVLLVGRKWGLFSLFGLLISFMVIFKLIIPMIISGSSPILAVILGSAIIIPTTFYISHGFNLKTHVGVIATTLALIITGFLTVYFMESAHLTGFSSEEAGFLQVEREGSIDMSGLLFAGIIIGILGILDDITIGQASVVEQIQRAKPKSSMTDLFNNGMKVGQDHISSMVNTLVLVYAGSALPLLLLFFNDNFGFMDAVELELIAEEIIRMLVGSIGLVLAAPLATILAAKFYTGGKRNIGEV